MNLDSSVGIAIGYGLNRGVGVRAPEGSSQLLLLIQIGSGGPPNLLSNGVPEIKRQGRETDHSPASSAEAKKTRIYTSTPPHDFMP
jgi:hypothetical protein